jgi:hypothetical protein
MVFFFQNTNNKKKPEINDVGKSPTICLFIHGLPNINMSYR